jgi:uncharacterized protein YbaP (TraB family)
MSIKDTSIPLPVWLGSGRSNARNRICRTVWLLCLLLLLGSCAATTRVGESKAALWKVQGDHNTVYLLGTIHVLSKQAYPLKPALERAFDDANQVVFEIDLSRFTQKSFKEEFSQTACYPSGQSLSNKLTPQTIELLNNLLPLNNLSLKKVERLKPWFLAEALSSRTLEMAGFSDRLGIDLYFYRKAKAVGKPVLGLETLQDVLFARRNSKWVPEIERFAHGDVNYLVIVGTGHLAGDDGVVAQLRRAGYSVQQL